MRQAEMFMAQSGGTGVYGVLLSLINCFLIVRALSLTEPLCKMRNYRHLL